MNSLKKRDRPAKKIGGGSLPLATASSPMAAASSATPSNGGHPRNAPGNAESDSLNSEWEATTVGELIRNGNGEIKTGPFGTKLKASEYTKTGVPVISVGEVGFGRFNLRDETPRVDEFVTLRMPEYVLHAGDIVFGRKGAVERSSIVRQEEHGWFLGSDGIRLRLPKSVDPQFISYQFLSEKHKAWMIQHAAGTTMASLNQGTIERIPITIPPLPIQQRIASILGSLDDKIALNRRINQTLEAMAQALFQSWFVDFDPVKAKQKILEAGGTAREAELAAMQIISGKNPHQLKTFQQTQPQQYAELEHTAKLFPNRLVESELGLVPEGWEWKNFGKFLQKTIGGDWGQEQPDEKCLIEVKILRGTDLPKVHSGDDSAVPTRFVDPKKLFSRQLFSGDVVVEVSGGSKDQPTGRSLFISSELIARYNVPLEPASFCRLFRPLSPEYGLYLALHMQRIYGLGKTWQYQNQSTGISNFQTETFLANEMVVEFPTQLLQSFFVHISPIYAALHSTENSELTQLRDSLLPKLLSGEISVENIGELQS